jgi:flagellar biosynthesis/type III secretory pathway protein FliH
MNKIEQRTTRDGRARLRTTDALQPLVEATRKLEASFDRAEERIENVRRAEAEKRLSALVELAVQNICGEIAEADRQKEEDAFERKLFGKLLPPTARQRLFGTEDSK